MRIYAIVGAVILLATSPGRVAAQSAGRGVGGDKTDVAGLRPQPAYDPVPIRLGAWSLAPAVRVTAGADSNIFGEQRGGRGDGFAIVSPSVRIDSGWARHGVSLSASGDSTRYFRFSDQNTDEYSARAAGRIDVATAVIEPSAEISRVAERKGTNGVPLSFREPSMFRTISETVTVSNQFASIATSLTARHGQVTYNSLVLPDETTLSQRFRDTETWSANGRIAFSFSSALAVVGYAEYGHGRSIDPIIPRTNDQVTLRGGGTLNIAMIQADVSVGYLQQTFANPAYPDFSGLSYDAMLTWSPTRFITITGRSRRSLENSGIIDVGAIVTRTDRIDIVYEMYRNLVLRGIYSHRRERYREIDTRSSANAGELRADLAFNRTVLIGVYGRRQCRDSAVAANTQIGLVLRSFCASIGGLSATLRP